MKLPFTLVLLKAYHAQANTIRPRLPELGLSAGQPKILDFLTRHDGCMQKDLAALCDIEPATISRLLDKMEADGLITRAQVPGNKRALRVCLTALGRQRREEFQSIRYQVEARELAGFTQTERDQFYDYLTRLYHNLTDELKEAPADE